MTITKTTAYALRTLGHMAAREHEVHSADALHSALKIPKKYLQRMLTDLARSGLLRSTRGRNGGFVLARKTKDISLAQIVHAVEGSKKQPDCFFGFAHCALDAPCAMHEIWVSSRGAIRDALTSTSLADIAGTTTR